MKYNDKIVITKYIIIFGNDVITSIILFSNAVIHVDILYNISPAESCRIVFYLN